MALSRPNQITIIRILLIAPFVISMLKVNEPSHGRLMRYAALGLFMFMCFSDALDGYLARAKKQMTRLGAFLDPMADKLLITCACILLASPGTAIDGYKLPPSVVVLIIGKDMLLSLGVLIVYLITSNVRIVPVLAGKVSTVLQLSMVTSILIAPDICPIFPGWLYFMRFLWWSAASAAIIAATIYLRQGIRYIEGFEQAENRRT